MGKKHISVTAARHSCRNVPVCVPVGGLSIKPSDTVALIDLAAGRQIPTQLMVDAEERSLCWIVDSLRVGETREYETQPGVSPSTSPVELVDMGDEVEFRIGGQLFTSYHYGGDIVRPFLYPILGPGGKGITRNYPMIKDVPGETSDHKHHRSVWVAFGDVNGADDWSEEEGCARIVHRQFLEKSEGPVFGRIRALNDWVDSGGRKLMEEVRTITIYNLPETGRIIDLGVVFRATEGDVRFGDTKEGGIASVRVATSIDGDKGGVITNCFGGVTEAECWGKPAHWCDYSGPVDGGIMGISIFDSPDNFRHPTRWHVRDYGLFAANPFALSAYAGDPNVDGSHVVKSGEEFPFAYRLYFHDGDAKAGNVAEGYHGYVNPPLVEAG
ncbi:MAG TPA: PmoA family protein [Armatimonadota bacterium]|nr:PmoA family protein [Armatimonadota bacterium]